jgi:hypothetical protein
MACFAVIYFNVDTVREFYLTNIVEFEDDIDSADMADVAITLNTECRRSIVTPAAGFAFRHIPHGGPVHALFGLKALGVTFVTGKLRYMGRVRVDYLSYLFILVNNVLGNMTSGTITCDTEGC